MRTTLTLDPDVIQALRDQVHRQRRPFKEVVNEAIRRGLVGGPSAVQKLRPYRVHPHRTALRPGIDPAALGRLADELEDDVALAKAGRAGRGR